MLLDLVAMEVQIEHLAETYYVELRVLTQKSRFSRYGSVLTIF